MKDIRSFSLSLCLVCGLSQLGHAHLIGGEVHYDWSVRPPESVRAPKWFLAKANFNASEKRPEQAAPFEAFAPRVKVRWDDKFLYVESNGLPPHNMMVGITAWQQQVPMPQNYTGDNAWHFPLTPVPSANPLSIKGRFLRGAIAIAANGIPIFNPQNNRGEVSAEIGELDQWGGHCGRADDYHYHAAPLHLQNIVGKGQPIAFALDGYPIFGLTEPDGSQPTGLDAFDGHTTAALGYHYHASTKYPYVNGGFHGEVVERDGQVDPQPRAQPVRPDLPPLRGAKITGFTVSPDEKSFALQYTTNGQKAGVNYATTGNGTWQFQFVSADGIKREETYRARQNGPAPRRGALEPVGDRIAQTPVSEKTGGLVLRSPAVTDGGNLPVEYTGDGESASPPLEWSGAPAGTKSYALIMRHLDPEGQTKWYWTLYNIPPTVRSLPKNAKGIGTEGNNSINNRVGYAPPHSKGPGAKTYVLTLYALSAAAQINLPPSQVSHEVLLAAIKDSVLATSDLHVVYTRNGDAGGQGNGGPPPRPDDNRRPPRPFGDNGGPPPPRPDGNGPPPRPDDNSGPRKPWLQQHGTELDTDHNSIITQAELEADANRAFAVYDTNKDGIITKAELDATGDVRDGSAFAGLIYRHFADLDTNGDGPVSHAELLAAAKYIFDAADANHDGKLSAAEWQNAPNTPCP